jgi:hypothetical protein
MDDVTVVVATRNRRAELERSLPRHEPSVIVVDNASTDDIADVVLRHRDTGLIRLPDNRGAAARTVGALAATTPFVAFADDDSWWAPGALAEGAELMRRHPEVALLNARIVVGAEQRPDPVCGTMARSPLDSSGDGAEIGPRILGFVACATLVRRDAFLRVGGFDDVIRFPGEEERVAIDLAARARRAPPPGSGARSSRATASDRAQPDPHGRHAAFVDVRDVACRHRVARRRTVTRRRTRGAARCASRAARAPGHPALARGRSSPARGRRRTLTGGSPHRAVAVRRRARLAGSRHGHRLGPRIAGTVVDVTEHQRRPGRRMIGVTGRVLRIVAVEDDPRERGEHCQPAGDDHDHSCNGHGRAHTLSTAESDRHRAGLARSPSG